jgi:tetratricopeptide (TPR) repeat protein
MLLATKELNSLNMSLADYYLTKLRRLEAAYHQGHEHSRDALYHFDKDWPQIQRWHDWAVSELPNDETARLCMAFSEAGMELLRLRQHPQERLDWLEIGLSAAQQLHDERSEMLHLYLLARLHNSLTNATVSQEYAEKALLLAEKRNDSLYQSKILITLSNTLYKSSDYELSHAYASKALQKCKALDAKQEIGAALNALANTELSQSNYHAAYEHYFEYLEIAELLGRPHDICLALHNLSNVTEIIGMRDESLVYAQRCVELARQTANHFQLATSLGMLGFLATEEARLLEAQDYLQESLDIASQLALPDEELHALGRLGNLRLLLGDYPGALDAYKKALELSRQGGFRHFTALALACLVQTHRLSATPKLALGYLREGLELTAQLKMHSIQILYIHEFAQLCNALGQSLEAALYIAVLEDNTEEFDKKDFQDFSTLLQNLEKTLGSSAFNAAKTRGKNLKLEVLLQEIYSKVIDYAQS